MSASPAAEAGFATDPLLQGLGVAHGFGLRGSPPVAGLVRPCQVHGCDVEEEDHPLPKDWIAAIMKAARENGGKVDWVNCGLCVDERGVKEAIDGCRRGTPGDLWNFANDSDNTLIIGTR